MSPNELEPGRAREVAEARAAAAGGVNKHRYVRRVFSEIAPRYDLLNHLLSANVDRGWRAAALQALAWRERPDGTYLDLCAGTLDVAARLATDGEFRGLVVAADFAEPMLRAGLGKASQAPLSVVAADALELPIANASLDGAVVAFGIRNVADLDAALREARRALSPGARLVILEFSMPRSRAVGALYGLYFRRVLPVVGRLVSGHPTAYSYLPQSVANFPVEEELAARMRAAGFRDVTWSSLALGIAAIHVGLR